MPRPLCFLTSFKLSSTQVLILGGSTRENAPSTSRGHARQNKAKSLISSQVYVLNLLEPRFTRLADLPRGFISLYPPFYDGQDNALLLINEDSIEDEPDCLRYRLDESGLQNFQPNATGFMV